MSHLFELMAWNTAEAWYYKRGVRNYPHFSMGSQQEFFADAYPGLFCRSAAVKRVAANPSEYDALFI